MNRLQKKCLVVSASCHGLLLLVLLVGPAFFTARDNSTPTQLLNMVSGRVVDDAMSSGGRPNTETAPPAAQPQPQPQPQPEVKSEPVRPVEPTKPLPPVKPLERSKPPATDFTPVTQTKPVLVKPKTDDFTFEERKPTQNNPKPSPVKNPTDSKPVQVADNSRQIATALGNIKSLKNGLSSGAKIEFNGQAGSDDQVSNYADIVFSRYYNAWTAPFGVDSGTVLVRVTIARDGRVTKSELITHSGNATLDKSIRNTLDNVTFIEPFPVNSKDLERTFTIEFDLAAKRSL